MYIIFRQRNTSRNAYWDGFTSILKGFPCQGLFLEIGAANPDQIAAHKKIFGKLVGLDYDFKRLPTSAGINMVNADAQFLPFKSNTFDGIISHHVIEHVKEDALFIKEIERTLKKGGFAIIGTPNRRRLVRSIIEIFSRKRRFPWREHKR